MKQICEYCDREIDSRGYDSHVHFKHRGEVLRRFRENPAVRLSLAINGLGPKLLPAAPFKHEVLLAAQRDLEDSIVDLIQQRRITAKDVQRGPGMIDSDVLTMTRALVQLEGNLARIGVYVPIWNVPIWQAVA